MANNDAGWSDLRAQLLAGGPSQRLAGPGRVDRAEDAWADLRQELLADSTAVGQQAEDAEALHSETADASEHPAGLTASQGSSGSTSESLSPPAATNLRTTVWWAQQLKRHVHVLGFQDPCPGGCNVKTLVSGCTGIFAEAEVLQVTGY